MIDIHCHLPFKVSDGPEDIRQSIAILESAASAGTTYINAVSHMGGSREACDRAVNELRPYAEKLGVTLHSGCEYDFLHFRTNLQDGICFAGPESRYVLVDLRSGTVPYYAPQQISELLADGINVIIVHPEMLFSWQQSKAMKQMLDAGAIFQINASSIAGTCGSEPKKTAFKCIENGMAHLIASDAHRPAGTRRWAMAEAKDILQKRYGNELCDLLFEVNPRLVLENKSPIQTGRQKPRTIFSGWFGRK